MDTVTPSTNAASDNSTPPTATPDTAPSSVPTTSDPLAAQGLPTPPTSSSQAPANAAPIPDLRTGSTSATSPGVPVATPHSQSQSAFFRWFQNDRAKAVTMAAELLSALSIVITAGFYLYEHAWLASRTDLLTHIAKSTNDTLSLYLSNEGGTDIVVTSMHIVSAGLDDYKASVKIPKGGQLIEHGKSMLISSGPSDLSAVVKTDGKVPTNVSTTQCTLTVDYIDSKGTSQQNKIQFECYAGCIIANE